MKRCSENRQQICCIFSEHLFVGTTLNGCFCWFIKRSENIIVENKTSVISSHSKRLWKNEKNFANRLKVGQTLISFLYSFKIILVRNFFWLKVFLPVFLKIYWNTSLNHRLKHTVWNVSKYGVFSGPYFPAFGLSTER